MRNLVNECVHGQLARSCNICELEKELANLRADLAAERAAHEQTKLAKLNDVKLALDDNALKLLMDTNLQRAEQAEQRVKELEQQLADANAKVERLLKYAKHKHDCAKNHDHGGCYCGNCTCGLAAELAGGKET